MITDSSHLDDLTKGFLAESREMLDEVEPYLIELGQRSAELGEVDEETVNLVFRLFHSLKGSAGFFSVRQHSGPDPYRRNPCWIFSDPVNARWRSSTRMFSVGPATWSACCWIRWRPPGRTPGYENEVEQISKETDGLDRGTGGRDLIRPLAVPPLTSGLPLPNKDPRKQKPPWRTK